MGETHESKDKLQQHPSKREPVRLASSAGPTLSNRTAAAVFGSRAGGLALAAARAFVAGLGGSAVQHLMAPPASTGLLPVRSFATKTGTDKPEQPEPATGEKGEQGTKATPMRRSPGRPRDPAKIPPMKMQQRLTPESLATKKWYEDLIATHTSKEGDFDESGFTEDLVARWSERYRNTTSGDRDIVKIRDGGVDYVVDATMNTDGAAENRTIGVIGRVGPARERDPQRQDDYPDVQREHLDEMQKSHLMAVSLGGDPEGQNLFGQVGYINQGGAWKSQEMKAKNMAKKDPSVLVARNLQFDPKNLSAEPDAFDTVLISGNGRDVDAATLKNVDRDDPKPRKARGLAPKKPPKSAT